MPLSNVVNLYLLLLFGAHDGPLNHDLMRDGIVFVSRHLHRQHLAEKREEGRWGRCGLVGEVRHQSLVSATSSGLCGADDGVPEKGGALVGNALRPPLPGIGRCHSRSH